MAELGKGRRESVPQALGRLRVALEDAYLRASRDLGLTPQQAELLCAAMRPAAIGDMALILRCDRSNVSRLVDRAASRGLVERQDGEEDGRVTVVKLTPKGEELAQRFIGVLESQTLELVAQWREERLVFAISVLNDLSDVLDAEKRRPSKRRRNMAAPRA